MMLAPQLRQAYTKLLPHRLRICIERTLFSVYPKEYDNNKYIFIHIPKTAGKSIISKLHSRGATHLSYSDYERILGDKLKDYFVFTVLRDPADRFASAFSYLKAGGNQSKEDQEFAQQWIADKNIYEFIHTSFNAVEVKNSLFFRSQASFLKKQNGALAPVKLLIFDTLQKDFSAISSRLGVSPDLPKLNESHSRLQILNDESLQIVQAAYQEDYSLILSTSTKDSKQE